MVPIYINDTINIKYDYFFLIFILLHGSRKGHKKVFHYLFFSLNDDVTYYGSP